MKSVYITTCICFLNLFRLNTVFIVSLPKKAIKTNSGENVGELKLKIEIFIPLRGGNKNQTQPNRKIYW